jgi:protein phosphatase
MDENPDRWNHCLDHAVLSDVGLRRSNNQDAVAVMIAGSQEAWQHRGHLFMVADGMGAHAAGELASKMAVDTVPLTYHKLRGPAPPEALRQAMSAANLRIFNHGQASDDFRGMGTTASTLVLLPQGAIVAQVGDSRIYRLRGNRLEQLTFDHSLVWEMGAAEQVTVAEIPEYVPRNIITRSLGPNAEVQIDLEGPFPLEVGDTFLLCSDGLTGPVADVEIGMILACLPAKEAVRMLVDLANLRGGPDNITVIVARVTGPQVALEPDGRPAAAQPSSRRAVHPLLWSLLGVCILAILGAIGLSNWPVAMAGLITAVVTMAAILLQRYAPGGPEYVFDGRPLGKGPHAGFDCAPDRPFAERLADLFQQVREAAARKDLTTDWHQLEQHRSRAAAAIEAGNYVEAVRQYCHGLNLVMDQFRHHRPNLDDWTIWR